MKLLIRLMVRRKRRQAEPVKIVLVNEMITSSAYTTRKSTTWFGKLMSK